MHLLVLKISLPVQQVHHVRTDAEDALLHLPAALLDCPVEQPAAATFPPQESTMKLNPEDLDVMSFDTGADLTQALIGAGPDGAVALAPTPTPNSRCFVCEYT